MTHQYYTGWVGGQRANKGFRVKRLDRWVQEMTVLEVRYEGKAKDPPAQAKDIKVVHRKGQTFITWTETAKIITKEKVLWREFEAVFKKHGGPRKGKFYRVYRHGKPITAGNLHEAELIDEIWPLSGYDARMHQHVVRGENWIGLDGEVHVLRHVIEDPPAGVLKPQGIFRRTTGEHNLWLGKQLPLHTGLYVHQVRKAGKAHYGVTACINGVENTRDIAAANSLAEPVEETVGPGEPILYRVLSRDAGRGRGRRTYETQCYLYWAAPPYANQPRRPLHIVIGLGGLSPSQTVQVRHSMKNMYGNELYRGIRNGYPIAPGARILLIVDDAAFQAKGYHDSWNTLRPRRAPSKYHEYPVRLEKVLVPWAKKLTKRGPAGPAGG